MKVGNEYTNAIDRRLFEACPKHVFAAIALSALTVGGDHIDFEDHEPNDARVLQEWWALYTAGIVPQKPPFPQPKNA